jgi:hypothetical protein
MQHRWESDEKFSVRDSGWINLNGRNLLWEIIADGENRL